MIDGIRIFVQISWRHVNIEIDSLLVVQMVENNEIRVTIHFIVLILNLLRMESNRERGRLRLVCLKLLFDNSMELVLSVVW